MRAQVHGVPKSWAPLGKHTVHFEFPVLERCVKYTGCSSSLGTQVGGAGLRWYKQGPRSPSWFPHYSIMPDPSSPPLLPLPRTPLDFCTGEDDQEEGTGRKNLGKADFSFPVMCINFLKIYLIACSRVLSSSLCLSPQTLPFVQHLRHTAGPGKAPPKITKALYLELLMVLFTVNSRKPFPNPLDLDNAALINNSGFLINH